MFNRLAVLTVVACATLLSFQAARALGQEKKEEGKKSEKDLVVEIVSPSKGDKVEEIDQIEGKLNAKLATKEAWPVVVVKAAQDTEWWIQGEVEEVKEGEFSVQAHFGSASTPPGTKYRIVAILAKSKADAAKEFKEGMTLKALPPASRYPRSQYVDVLRM